MNTWFKRFWGLCILGLVLFSQCFGLVPQVRAAGSNWFVKSDGTGTDCSQSNPCEPGQAMTNAVAGDTIYFRYGLYYHLTNDPYFTVTKPVSLIGGWDGASSGDVVVDPEMYVVIVDGGSGRALFAVNDTTGTEGLITITGFTFQEGYTANSGAAIYVQNGRVDIISNIFLNNFATNYGGAIAIDSDSDIQILNNWFDDNGTGNGGGSIFAGSSDATVLIDGNSFTGGAANYGTAIHNDRCRLIINGNLFKDNPGNSTIYLYSNSVSSIVSNNFLVRSTQAAIYLGGTSTTPHEVINNTIVGAVYGIAPSNSSAYIFNNIISYTDVSIFNSSGTLVGSNNLFYENDNDPIPLTDPVYADPAFVDPYTDNYHLDVESPAVDAGAVVPLSDDYDGDERPIGDGFDIGADETGFLIYLPFGLQ